MHFIFTTIGNPNGLVLIIKNMNNKDKRVEEKGVMVKCWNPKHVFNINGTNYVPLSYIEEFTDYSRSRIKGLINSWKIDKNAILKISNLTFIMRDYIPALQMMYFDPDKWSRQSYMIDIYYNKKEI